MMLLQKYNRINKKQVLHNNEHYNVISDFWVGIIYSSKSFSWVTVRNRILGVTISQIPDDISYALCLNPNIWPTLVLLYWLVTLNISFHYNMPFYIWFDYNMPFYKTNTWLDLHSIHSCSQKTIVMG